jgi:hypothetical protein
MQYGFVDVMSLFPTIAAGLTATTPLRNWAATRGWLQGFLLPVFGRRHFPGNAIFMDPRFQRYRAVHCVKCFRTCRHRNVHVTVQRMKRCVSCDASSCYRSSCRCVHVRRWVDSRRFHLINLSTRILVNHLTERQIIGDCGILSLEKVRARHAVDRPYACAS